MGFDHLSVMVVDDSRFVLNMITSIFRALKVGKIVALPDAAAAITELRTASKSAAAARTLVPDIIICDWLMSPIAGDMLLRWVRQHEDSPDRFIPFIMVSGAADSEKVRVSRDLGVTEFLAKPFSVQGVADHIIAAIEQPRPYVYTRDYFGPDRRRQRRPFNDVDRRVATEQDVEIIYSATIRPLKAGAKAFIFKLPNRLREKVSGLGRSDPIVIPPELLQAAEQQLDRMEGDYADWVRGSMRKLIDAHKKAVDAPDGKTRAEQMIIINRQAHELRGQGSTFGYPLITVFGRSLYECSLNVDLVEDQLLDFVKAHLDGITAVVRDKIKGSGGDLGRDLVGSLEVARNKLRHT